MTLTEILADPAFPAALAIVVGTADAIVGYSIAVVSLRIGRT